MTCWLLSSVMFYRLENSTLNFKKRKHSQHEDSGPAVKKIKTFANTAGGQQKHKLMKVMRNDTAKQIKEALSVELCNAKEQMVEEVKQADRDACTTDSTDTVLTNLLGKQRQKKCAQKVSEENRREKQECGRRLKDETAAEETDEQAVPRVNHSDQCPAVAQDEDLTELDEDKRAIRDAEKALRSLSGDWDGEDDFFSSLSDDTGRECNREKRGTSTRKGKTVVEVNTVVVEPTESTEILVNGNRFDAADINIEENEEDTTMAAGGEETPRFQAVLTSEDENSVKASEGASKADDTVEALLKIEQECACIQFLVGRQSPYPTANQQTDTSRQAGEIQVGGETRTGGVVVKQESAQDEVSPQAAEEVKADCRSFEAQILQSNPLLYGKLDCETRQPEESEDIKPSTGCMETDGDAGSDMEYITTDNPTINLGKHNGDTINSRIFTSGNNPRDTSQIEAAQMEAAVILQEMSSKSDKEAATILQQMSIGNGNSGLHQSNARTFSPHQDTFDTDSQGKFSFLDGFRKETSPAVRPTTLENLHSVHESCKKGNTTLYNLFDCYLI